MKQTPMQDLLQDLKETKVTSFNALNDINDKFVKEAFKELVNKTLDCIINRIEGELLPKEEELIINAVDDQINRFKGYGTFIINGKEYYNETFKK